ncbi:MAG: hypothetical protein JWL76_728 [Thermoleophilia bacterium]|nr:hypothetical protein [Thermoleophilia bacterium]
MDSGLQTTLVVLAVAGAATWILVVATTAGWGMRVRSGDDPAAVVSYARRIAKLSLFVALPAALLAAVAGGWFVADRDLALVDNWWVGTGIGAWIVAFFGSSLLRGPQLNRAVQISSTAGADDEDVQWRIRQVDLTSRGELVLLVVAAIVLVIRPT